MASYGLLASTVVTGALLLGVGLWLLGARPWRRVAPRREAEDAVAGEHLVRWLQRDERAWLGAFALLVALVGGAGVLAAQGEFGAGPVVLGFVVMIAAYVVAGTYAMARSRGHVRARATGEATVVLGLLAVLALVLNLVAPGLA